MTRTYQRTPADERFVGKFEIADDGCWVWTGHRTPEGYGRFLYDDHLGHAHRYAYETAVEPIPAGLEIDHLCRNRACVNPDHLEPVTHRENSRRGNAGAYQLAKTHCPQGHEYTEENTYSRPSRRQERRCRICKRVQGAAYMRRRRRR